MPELVAPNADLYEAFCEMTDEWTDIQSTSHGMSDGPRQFASREEFAEWVDRLVAGETVAEPGRVTCSYFWIMEDGRLLGGISLRHELNDYLLHFAGHIGYSVRPSARGRGLASWATQQVLVRAGERGIERALIVCDGDNIASARVIEKCGGVLEDIREGDCGHQPASGLIRRYWVPTRTDRAN